MTYFAGNTGKFMYGGIDVAKLANVNQSIEALNEAAELNAAHAREMGALGAYSKQQDTLYKYDLRRDLESMQSQTDDRSTMLDGIEDVISGVGSLLKFNPNKFEYGKTPLKAGGGVVDGVGTLGPNYGIPQEFGAAGGYLEGFGGTLSTNWGIE